MKVHFICQHPPVEIDANKSKGVGNCPDCGETKRASVLVRPPSFSAQGLAVRGPLVKQEQR